MCPGEAHWMIGAIERRNSILRVLEKLVEQCCVENEEQLDQIIPLALHAINSSTFSRGLSAFQATFGRFLRLRYGLLGDDHSLASSAGRLGHLEDNQKQRSSEPKHRSTCSTSVSPSTSNEPYSGRQSTLRFLVSKQVNHVRFGDGPRKA